MTQGCSPKVTHPLSEMMGPEAGFRGSGGRVLARGQIRQATRIVMKTIILPEGNAFGADDIDSRTHYAEHPARMLFLVWVTLTEHKWVILRERRRTDLCGGRPAMGVPTATRSG